MLLINYAENEEGDGIYIAEIIINSDDPKLFERCRRLVRMILGPDAELTQVKPKKD